MENPREQKGLVIAATSRIVKDGAAWIVPSQANASKKYRVDVNDSRNPKCSCPDYEARRVKCKHVFAVEYALRRVEWPDGSTVLEKTVRVTYGQNWAAYNAAQTTEKDVASSLLRGLCAGIEQPPQRRGRPRLPLADVTFAAVMKVFTTVSGRRAISDIRQCEEKGHITKAPHYNSVFNYLENPSLTPILKKMVAESAAPLKGIESSFAVDSSGFSTCVFERWYDERYRRLFSEHRWVKVHLMTGVLTNVIASVEITERNVSDFSQFPTLVNQTSKRFSVAEVSADKGYLSKKNMELVETLGATPYIAFKSDSKAENGCEIWRRMFHLFQLNRDEYLAHYHRRSNVESTFSMLKRKFGASVRSKTDIAQVNEILCKVICHNLSVLVHSIHEFGIAPTFWAEVAPAQEIQALP
jgi:transposase